MTPSDSKSTSTHEKPDELTRHVLPHAFGGGPQGWGDPSDKSLRKIEQNVLIMQKVRDAAHLRCRDYVRQFEQCGKREGFLLPFKCRKENHALQDCLKLHFADPAILKQAEEEYLQQRADFRETGIPQRRKPWRKTLDEEDLKQQQPQQPA